MNKKNPIRILSFFALFFIFNSNLFSQTDKFDAVVSKGIKEIYSIKFEEAETTFRSLIADYPDHPAGRFFLAMIDWWKILLNPETEEYDDIFYQKLEDVIYQCEEILDENPENVDALFFKGGAIGFRGRLRALRESWIKAADDGREALPVVERAASLDPDNIDVKLGFGIYNYYAAVIPEEYPIIKPLMIFFPSGNKEEGIEQLNAVADFGKYAKYEARYFLMTLYYNYENNPYEAERYAVQLTKDFPDNPTFQRWLGRIAAKKGEHVIASQIFKSIIEKADSGLTGYNNNHVLREAAYYVGLQYRNEDKLDSAKIYFKKCADISREIDEGEESGFLINSYLYLGMINDLQGNRSEAKEYYEALLDMREYGKSRSMAKEYLEKPYK